MNKMSKRLLSFALVLIMCTSVMQVPVAYAASGTASDIVSIGNNEKDGTKGEKYLKWFYGKDNGYAWCAVFVSWCANQAGIPTNVIPKTAGVGVMRTGVLNGGGKIVESPQAGDLVFYKIHKDGSWGHVGLMTSAKSSVQGNLGHKVLHVAKSEDYCLGDGSKAYTIQYIRPNYSGSDVIVDKIPPENVAASVTTGACDNLTQISAILRGSFTTTGARASECGMYIGTSANNLKKLGSDKVNTYGTSMYYSTSKYGYTLELGKTYYYQAYAKANGTTYKGEIKSFTTPGENASISLDRTSLTMKNGTCTQLTATTNPAGQTVTWSSSDTSVATVTSNGGIDTRKAGTTTITAKMTYGGKQYPASCTVTVTPDNKPTDTPTASVSLNRNSLKLDVNAGVCGYLTAAVSPADSDVIWTSSDTSIVTVSNGVVEPVKSGEAIIYASILYDGELYFDTCKVTVTGVSATVITKGADNISQTNAIVRGDVTVSSGTVTECGMYIGGSASSLTKLGSDKISKGTPFYYSTSKYGYALTAGTTYYYQAYAIVDGKTIWGDVESFETGKTAAAVTTKGADNITQTSAIVRGEVTVSSGTVTECGMYIGDSASNMIKLGSDSISKGTPFYYSTSKYGYSLTAGTTYYYQAYAIVDGKTIWGDVKSFTTSAATVSTTTRSATVVNTNGQYLAINNAAAASPKYSTQIGRIPPGGTVTVDTSKTSGSWYWVTYNGVSGYAYGKYLSLN